MVDSLTNCRNDLLTYMICRCLRGARAYHISAFMYRVITAMWCNRFFRIDYQAPISILAATLQILSQKRERDEGKGYSSTKQASAKQFQKSPLLRYWIHSYIITLESFANNWSFIGWDHLKPDSTCVLMKAFYRISTYLGTNYPFLTFTSLVPYDGAASTSCPAILHARSTCILSSRNQVSGKTMK